MAEIEDELACADSGKVSGSWTLKLGTVRAELVDDAGIGHGGAPLARAAMQEVSLVSTIAGHTHLVAGSVTVSCTAFHELSGQWEPIVEPWKLELESITTRGDPKQYLKVTTEALDVSFAAVHLLRVRTVNLAFQASVQEMRDSLLAAELIAGIERMSSDAVRKKELSSFVNDFSASTSVMFTNSTSVALGLKLQVASEAEAAWESRVDAGGTVPVSEALLQSHLLH
eukprot:60052-Rhodomonas_salina.1